MPRETTRPSTDDRAKLLLCLEIGKALTSTFDLACVLRLIMQRGSEVIRAENWSLLLRDQASGDLVFEVVVGIDPALVRGHRLPRGVGIAGYVAEHGEAVCVPDVREDPRFDPRTDHLTGFRTRSVVCVPLRGPEGVLGVIEVVNVHDVGTFEAHEAPFLQILADYAAIAINNARHVMKIEELTLTDEYTGLRNARFLHARLEELLEEACAASSPLSVAFVDMDNFKSVVDAYGHMLGSQVLREVGGVMASSLEAPDTLVKYGGDEFVVLMPGKGVSHARDVAERLRSSVEAATFLQAQGACVRVTASFGVATFPVHATTKKALLLEADTAMHRAKRRKNAVEVARPEGHS